MSTMTPDIDIATRRYAAERARLEGRSRRSGAGSVTEMVRSLAREARAAEEPAAERSRLAARRRRAQGRCSRSNARRTLPLGVFGSSGTNSTMRGYL